MGKKEREVELIFPGYMGRLLQRLVEPINLKLEEVLKLLRCREMWRVKFGR